jgi:hypothetical protein
MGPYQLRAQPALQLHPEQGTDAAVAVVPCRECRILLENLGYPAKGKDIYLVRN